MLCLSHAHFAAVKRVLKRQQRKLYQATQWRGYIAKNARAHQQVLMIIKKTALFCLMQSMHGTAVPERKATMTKFIEVHLNGVNYLINLAHVEEILCDTDGKCTIYFAFSVPDAIEQDYMIPDETYDQIKRKIFEGE